MKRALIIAAVLVLLCLSAACAESDLTAMSFEDLQHLIDSYDLEIWKNGGWTTAIVPPGHWKVGVDIPSGVFEVRAASDESWVTLLPSGSEMYSIDIDYRGSILDATIKHSYTKLALEKGQVLHIDWRPLEFKIGTYAPAFSAFDGSDSKSVDDLLAAKKLAEDELRSRQEWEEVFVPEGPYTVGETIPAGVWSVWPVDGMLLGFTVNDNGAKYGFATISPSRKSYSPEKYGDRIIVKLVDGYDLEVSSNRGAIFTPYAGHPAITFNK